MCHPLGWRSLSYSKDFVVCVYFDDYVAALDAGARRYSERFIIAKGNGKRLYLLDIHV